MSRWLRSVNEVMLIWWVANDPIAKENKAGQKLVVFNIATRRAWITKDWQRNEEVQYHKIATWWKLAERIETILTRWAKIYIKWYLHNRKVQIEWEEKPRIITEIIANDILLLDRRKKEGEDDTQDDVQDVEETSFDDFDNE